MSTAELKAVLHERIETLDENSLALADRLLAELKLEELRGQLEADFAAAKRAGQLEPERIQAVIEQVRKEHPYR